MTTYLEFDPAEIERHEVYRLLTGSVVPLVIGEVVYFHVDPQCMTNGYIDMKKFLPIGRLNGFIYSTLGDIFEREFHDGQPR